MISKNILVKKVLE